MMAGMCCRQSFLFRLDGPYLVVQHVNGLKERKRWYGRLEDGYIAWISINLFEYFGAVVYQPLDPFELKQGKVPRWMYDMWSLPNIAIPLSYFCIGVALQLLRTPLIVYLIEDLDASPSDVNVLFTVMAVPWCFKVLYGFDFSVIVSRLVGLDVNHTLCLVG